MIQVRMGQQYVVDAGGIEAEWCGIILVNLATALMEPAVDQDAFPSAFHQMTGTGDTAIGAMKG
jgi:hypothetical protein